MIYKEVTCPVCGCACDDIEVVVEDNKIVEVNNACSMGTAKFFKVQGKDRLKTPMKRENGRFKEISWKEAIETAADILKNSKYPLIFGFSETSCECIKIGIDIAEKLGGFIDNQTSQCHSPTIIAEQNSGLPLCTLGMAINYADLIIYWGSNPEESHPRHMSRFTTYPRGIYREEGRRDREIVVIDVRRTGTAKLANYFYEIEPNKDFELIVALEMLIDGKELNEEEIAGLSIKEIKELAYLLKNCEYGVIFVGLGIANSLGKSYNLESLFNLVKKLNNYTRMSIIPMRGHFNVAGFCQVLTWRSGYPFAVDYSRGYPRYNPGETTLIDLLSEGVVDAMLSISADPVSHFPRRCVEHMTKIPLIAIDIVRTPTTELADLIIPGIAMGIESGGTYFRMDNVPLTAKKIIEPEIDFVKSDEEILKKIWTHL